MAESPVNVTLLATGVPIAGDSVTISGTSAIVQQVKLMGGAAGDTTPIPAVSTQPASGQFGLGVWVGNPGGGSVGISGSVQVSGTVQVSDIGPVSISGIAPTTTGGGLSGQFGLPVWVGNPSGAGTTVVSVTGSVLVSGLVSAGIIGTVNVSQVGQTTTQSGLTTGQAVWLAPTQTITVNNVVSITGTSINVVVSGLVSVTGTSLFITGPVQISGITPTTTASGLSGVTAFPVWFTTPISITGTSINVVVSGIVSVTGTSINVVVSGIVSVTGTSLNVVVSGVVSVSAGTLGVVSTVATVLQITNLSTVVTLLGVVGVSQSAGVMSSVLTVLQMTNLSSIITIVNTVAVSQVASGSILIRQSVQTPVMMVGSIALAAVASSSAGPIPFTVFVGTTVGTVTSAWSVPATNFRIYAINIFMTGAGATSPTVGFFQVAYSSAGTTGTITTPTVLGTKPQLAAVGVGAGPVAASFGFIGAQLDTPAGLTQTIMLWFNYPGTTNTAANATFLVLGYLF